RARVAAVRMRRPGIAPVSLRIACGVGHFAPQSPAKSGRPGRETHHGLEQPAVWRRRPEMGPMMAPPGVMGPRRAIGIPIGGRRPAIGVRFATAAPIVTAFRPRPMTAWRFGTLRGWTVVGPLGLRLIWAHVLRHELILPLQNRDIRTLSRNNQKDREPAGRLAGLSRRVSVSPKSGVRSTEIPSLDWRNDSPTPGCSTAGGGFSGGRPRSSISRCRNPLARATAWSPRHDPGPDWVAC